MVKKGEYKGKAILTLLRDENDRFPFSFGMSKAKLIVENFDSIKEFAAVVQHEANHVAAAVAAEQKKGGTNGV